MAHINHSHSPKSTPDGGDRKQNSLAETPATVGTEVSGGSDIHLSLQTNLGPSFSIRAPKASPSRHRLDKRYAARLATPSPRSEAELMPPPPKVTRDAGMFRPSPILTVDTSLDSTKAPSFSPSMRSLSSSSCGSDWNMTPQMRTKRKQCSDRFIPSRGSSNFTFNLWEEPDATAATPAPVNNTNDGNTPNLLNTLLRSELLGENDNPSPSVTSPNSAQIRSTETAFTPIQGANILSYRDPRREYLDSVFNDQFGSSAVVESFSLNPVKSAASQRLMARPPKRKRRISKVPFKVLDAPALQDDFYLNLVDWSSQNILAVALGPCVYLWSACSSQVTKLCDLSSTEDTVTAVSWAQRGTHLAIGTNRGDVQLWDTIKGRKLRSMEGHTARVGTLAWKGPVLASGSRDRAIYLRDVRVEASYSEKLSNHKQEVCGLRWSFDDPGFLASGGNDNNLHVIDPRKPLVPVHRFSDHTAAVKAIAWSPHQHGLLASGGGTADRCIRFWNTLSGVGLSKIDTGSQVCNIAWSRNCNEIVSTHGYSLNQIIVWRYPNMSKVTTLTGHTFRVLYLAMSPDGSTVVTGAGDETLRFWQIFPSPQSDSGDSNGGLLFPNTPGSVIR